jgi:hypothetical protein
VVQSKPSVTQEILSGSGLSLGQAARCFPPYRESKPVNPSTIFRWITTGVRLQDGSRLRLEARRVGGRWLTSREAVQRFIDAQTPIVRDKLARLTTQTERARRAERAGKELEKAGI